MLGADVAAEVVVCVHIPPEEIGLIVLAASTPDYATFPSTAYLVQSELGCPEAGAAREAVAVHPAHHNHQRGDGRGDAPADGTAHKAEVN